MSESTSSSLAALPRTVLVTGAAQRLGRAIALDLACAGWRVVVHYAQSRAEAEQTAAECAALTPGSLALAARLDDEAEARALLPAAAARLGRVDAVVNNASVFAFDDAASFGYVSMERHWRVNTGAAIVLAQALSEHLGAARDGRQGAVVNLLDQKLWNPNPDFLSYTLSKAALESATTLLAQALAPRVRVVGVAPGLTLTSEWLSPERFAALHRLSPLGRSSTPDDVARAVRFALESPAITGTTLLVDGGQHLQRFERDFSRMP
ncbi:MAG TPA: SDR family oxidoreductase [Burkholderiaceae bacterium]|jgi:NAD(P)-dependent dehydrogenase (short-subunit alcohol dehydrogenase family)|nr:SDR family oxidoreductase [Burkholderiaceae bacterium]